MCGIAGYIGPETISQERIEDCLGDMGRRGPDATGARSWEGKQNVYLLHSRLNIIDLDNRANQPFNSGSHWLAYNGELYNYVELRRILECKGVVFSTQSDTETLLEVLRHDGLDALDDCEGMWAFALYDETEKRLTLCRDRFGEKPLYIFREANGGIYFGSEIKFIATLRGRWPAVNHEHLLRYMVNGYRSLYKTGATFFAGVSEVESAMLWNIDSSGEIEKRRYWTPRTERDESMSYEEAVAGTRKRLIESVRIRLRADVPLAFMMSGGVDSNGLIGIATKEHGFDVHGFTLVDGDERYGEGETVARAAADLGVRNTQVPASRDGFFGQLDKLVDQHDAPVYTISYYAQWTLLKSVSDQGYRITVSGTGADELFSGYYDHHLAYLYEISSDSELYAASVAAWEKHIKPITRNPFLGKADAFIKNPGLRDHLYLNAGEFAQRLKKPWSEAFTETAYDNDLLRNRMLNELYHESVPVILHEDDHNAMYYSIENRSPYLDRRLFEFAARIPTRHLVRDGYAKAVLRDAVRGFAPDEIVDARQKVGFNMSIDAFLDRSDPETRSWILDDGPIYEHVRKEAVEVILNRDTMPNSESKFLFYFINCKLFLERAHK
ncbi:MAG TPA: asparagine synthase (glutamine-hydrolyzing) [Nitrospirae bacterium]|nr:asparagine synthase (glutamine-hydrolyzing) [Nitrospirota bacterium]